MDLKEISQKRQKKWKETDLYKVKEDISKPKFYILDMFPYPSGSALHVGHPKGYIATDVLARKKMLQGFNVLHPMGFDTFGLGTEQYAIEHKMKPQDVSKQNIAKFVSQLENFGTTYDRSRSVNTADPKYFTWTQRVFLQMYNHYYDEKLKKAKPIEELKLKIENGKLKIDGNIDEYLNKQRLAYVDYKPINRCPKCMTGLANEDLDDGKCERCGSEVEQKPMKQRVLRITTYAERLLDGLNDLQRDESMKDLERNWIGKSEGTEFDMNVAVPNKVSKVIILHGITGHDQRHRFQWLKKEMDKQGVEVFIPNLPNTDNPNYTEQLEFLKKEFTDKLDENTIIIGHSLGCLLGAMFLLETGKKIKKLISVGPVFEGIKVIKEHTEVVNYVKGIHVDTKKLEDLLDEHIIFISKTDPHIPYETVKEYYEKNFYKKVIISFEDKGHFSDRNGNLTEFPELLNYVCSNNKNNFSVYTTRVDTVFGMSFVAIAPEHPLVDKITTAEHKAEVEKYKEAANKKTQLERTELQKDKTGVFCGAYAINPFNGESVPIFVADYVLANYGTGVVMAVPAHDERDFEFAKKYNLPITQSVMYVDQPPHEGAERRNTICAVIQRKSDNKFLCLHWKKFGWISPVIGGIEGDEDCFTAAEREVLEETGYHAKAIKKIGRQTESNFFAENKNVWRQKIDQSVVLELLSETPDPVDPEELEKHEVLWLSYEEAIAQVTHKDNLFGLIAFVEGERAYTQKGNLVNSGAFTGLSSDDAIEKMQAWLATQGIGGKKINYRMQDRVFSRQRYRGEPFPILRTETQPKLRINFYEQTTRQAILEGTKTIETRALNPEEPDRYFGNVKVGDILEFNNKENGKLLYVKVKNTYQWKNLEDLRNNANKTIIEKMYTNKATFTNIKTLEDLYKGRDFQPGYVDKINTHGLVGREIEIVTPEKNIIALDEKELPLLLPDVENYEPTGTEEGPLANISDWVNVTLPDGTKAKRETNTMPGRAGSSRYWLRYMDVNNDKALVGKDKEAYRGSVDVYVGGAEHITRHMIYGRFWQKFLFDIGAITHEEPFQEYHSVGLIMGEDGRKMSKRRGNVVNPDDIINEFGTDVLRAYEMFMGPFDQSIAWSTNGIKGIKKFLDKIIALEDKISDAEETNETKIFLNQSIKKLTEDIDGFRFNTAISQLMILVNHLTECTTITQKTFEDLIILVSPFAPHLAEELREHLGNEYSVFTKATWPKYDEKCLVADTVTIGVQINGKVRGSICISKEAQESEVMALAKADEKIAARIVSEPKKVVYVKGKILNIVV